MIRSFIILASLVALLFTGDLSAFSTSHSHAPDVLFYLGFGVLGVTLSSNALTLLDWSKRLDPDGKIAAIVELLMQTNEILEDMLWIEGNLPTGHRTTVRTGLPLVYWRLLNQGVAPSKSDSAQIDEQAGMLEAWSEVDKDLAMLNGNTNAFRLSEARAFLEAMNQELASTLFYGNSGLAPEEFTGLAVRYSDLDAPNGEHVIDAEGSTSGPPTDLTSIYLVSWGAETVHGIFPKGSKAGLIHDDYGEVTVEVTAGVAGNRMRALQERYQWKAGLVVKDWRHAVRIANIDISELAGASPADLIEHMEHAIELLPNRLGRPVFYCNRTVRRYLRKQVREAVGAGGGLTFENFAGKRVLMFGDVPVKTCDAILSTEAEVTT